jgi:molecular chaperone DnaK (HSP70)
VEEIEEEDLTDLLGEVEQLVADDTGYSVSDVHKSRMTITNVTSKSFGVIAHDAQDKEIIYNLILKNSGVPITTTRSFGTAVDNQNAAAIQIMENESNEVVADPEHAVTIGTAVLNLPTDLKENTPVEITFKLNEEGRLEITAEETSETRRSVNVTIETKSVITGDEFEEAKTRGKSAAVS